jgi:hypothetical protein
MGKTNIKSWVGLMVIFLSVYSCIETFFPELENKAGFLVIDALITDEARSYDVYLTRSVSALNSKVTYVKGAYVSISDNTGKEFTLQEISTGHYVTDNKKFTGQIGNRYILYIKTSTGEEYRSDTCTMYGTSKIDQIHIGKNTKYTENGIDELTGLSLYLDGEVSDKKNCFLKWDFSEAWKFSVPYPVEFSFSPPNLFTEIVVNNQYCWKNAKSKDILIHSFQEQENGVVKDKELAFFLTNQSNRFSVRYSVLVNQYAISWREYKFWNQLRATNEEGGGIFEKQPYSISGNIKNISDPDEVVLGYFQVASVYSKRIYIDPLEVSKLKLPFFINPCETKTYQIGDMEDDYTTFRSLSAIYNHIIKHDSVLVRPYWNDLGDISGMTATSKNCSNCSLSGDSKKPSFWTD